MAAGSSVYLLMVIGWFGILGSKCDKANPPSPLFLLSLLLSADFKILLGIVGCGILHLATSNRKQMSLLSYKVAVCITTSIVLLFSPSTLIHILSTLAKASRLTMMMIVDICTVFRSDGEDIAIAVRF
jgi:hypothetical protein